MSRRLQQLINTGYNGYELSPNFDGWATDGGQVDLSTQTPQEYPDYVRLRNGTSGSVNSEMAGGNINQPASASGFDVNAFANTAKSVLDVAGPLLAQILNLGKQAGDAFAKKDALVAQGASPEAIAAASREAEALKAAAQKALDDNKKKNYLLIAGGVGIALLALGFLATRR